MFSSDMNEDDCLDNSSRSLDNSMSPDSSWSSFLIRAKEEDPKNIIITDNIHGHIEVPLVCQAVIDTPQFDRLRSIRQLGCAHYVYPGAKHSRWEHSLGVMHLAGQFVDHLMRKKPGCANQIDKLCVMLAGLCHDLGHGPFSHLWETFVQESAKDEDEEWRHEKTSLDMLDLIIESNCLSEMFEVNGLTEIDIRFVKEMIFGPLHMGVDVVEGDWPYQGRGADKFFLYEIVANKISSIDVDKWDYMLRDNSALRIGLTFDYRRFIMYSDVLDVDGRSRLCIRKKEAENVQDMFLDRARLHRKGYQHRTIKIIDRMMVDALVAADPFLKTGPVPMSRACHNVVQFSRLSDDYLIRMIQNSEVDCLRPAREILNRISRRQLYKLVGSVDRYGNMGYLAREELMKLVKEEGVLVETSDLAIIKKKVNMGMGNTNPVEKVLFVDKSGRTVGFDSDQMKQVLPQEIISESLLVVCRRDDLEVLEEARQLVNKWGKRLGVKVRLSSSGQL